MNKKNIYYINILKNVNTLISISIWLYAVDFCQNWLENSILFDYILGITKK